MKAKNQSSFGAKLLSALFKILLFILVFPYQIIINRKEERYSLRCLLACLVVKRNQDDEGKKSFQYALSVPGLPLSDIKKKKNAKKESENTED